jgi:hypothetical protein
MMMIAGNINRQAAKYLRTYELGFAIHKMNPPIKAANEEEL